MKSEEYQDMTPDVSLPYLVAEVVTQYGYTERALGICKTMSVDDPRPEAFTAKELERRDRAAARMSEIVGAAIGVDGEITPVNKERAILPAALNKAINYTLRAHVVARSKPGSRSKLRTAIAEAIADASQAARAEVAHETRGKMKLAEARIRELLAEIDEMKGQGEEE